MSRSIFFICLLAVAICGNCGVYSTKCLAISGVSWSRIATITVSCGFNGYVNGIVYDSAHHSNSACNTKPFVNNVYSYQMTVVNGETAKDNAKYTGVLKSATLRSDDIATMKTYFITCTPDIKQGKTYSLKDITCKVGSIIGLDFWSGARESIGKSADMQVTFETKDSVSTATVAGGVIGGSYTKTGSFWGCWSWWSIILVALVVIIIIVAIVLAIVIPKRRKTMPKKK